MRPLKSERRRQGKFSKPLALRGANLLPSGCAKILVRIFNYVFSDAAVFASRVSSVFKILFLNFLRFSGSCCSIPHVHSASKQFTSSSAVRLSIPKSKPNAIKSKCGRSILRTHVVGIEPAKFPLFVILQNRQYPLARPPLSSISFILQLFPGFPVFVPTEPGKHELFVGQFYYPLFLQIQI